MKEFAVLLALFIGAFASIFHLLIEKGRTEQDGDRGFLMQLWKTYSLTVLGAFDESTYLQSTWTVIFFQIIVLATNVVMLNVLITIVGEGYNNAQSKKTELLSRQ